MSTMVNISDRAGTRNDLRQQALALSHEEMDDRSAGWLAKFANGEQLGDVAIQVQDEIHKLRATANRSDDYDFQSIEKHCCEQLVLVVKAGALRHVRDGKKNRFLRKVSEKSDNFCEIALHYQNAFDVLSNTGDYTSAIWGAVKILMIYRVNDKNLQSEVKNHLRTIGVCLTEISAFSCIPSTRAMQQTITSIYSYILDFLSEALKYYKESKTMRVLKNSFQPFEIRFKPILQSIHTSVQTVHRMVQVVAFSLVEQLNEKAARIEEAVNTGTQNIASMVQEGQFAIIQGQTGLFDQMRTLEASLLQRGDRTCTTLALWDETTKNQLWKEHIRHRVLDRTVTLGELREGQIISQCEALFPTLGRVREAKEVVQRKYKPSIIMAHEDDSPSVANLQWSLRTDPEVRRWTTESQSHFLQIEGYQESTSFDWTTKFCLDIQRLAASFKSAIVLSFFADEKEAETTPSLVLQSFILQIVLQRPEQFTAAACYRQAVSIDRLRECGSDLMKLWSLFAVCLDLAQVHCIFVVLDNIDVLIGRSTQEELRLFFRFLGGLAHSDTPICKILTTYRFNGLLSDSMASASEFSSSFSGNNSSILQVPRALRVGSTLVQKRQKHRLSIVGEDCGPFNDVMLAMLDAEDDDIAQAAPGAEDPNASDNDDDVYDLFRNDETTARDTTSAVIPKVQAQDNSSDTDSLVLGNESDGGFSDLFDSDMEVDSRTMKQLPANHNTKIDGVTRDVDSAEDDMSLDLLSSSDDDLDLRDLDIEPRPAQTMTSERTQKISGHIEAKMNDDDDFRDL